MASVMPHRTVLPYNGFTLRETTLERVQAALLSIVVSLVIVCGTLIVTWTLMWIVVSPTGPGIEDTVLTGPIEVGQEAESFLSFVIETPSDQEFVSSSRHSVFTDSQTIEQVVSFAESTSFEAASAATGSRVTGEAGSPFGTDHANGRATGRTVPLHRRWIIQFDRPWTVEDYSACLEQLGIELCAVQPGGHRIYLQNISTKPVPEQVNSAGSEDRFSAAWSDGELQQLDQALFNEAGVDVSAATVVHIFPDSLVDDLERQEVGYVGLPLPQIRRTTFAVRKTGGRFQFVVVGQRQR